MHRFLDAVDRYIDQAGLSREVLPPIRPGRIHVPDPVTRLDLAGEHLQTVIIAAGYCTFQSWNPTAQSASSAVSLRHRGCTS